MTDKSDGTKTDPLEPCMDCGTPVRLSWFERTKEAHFFCATCKVWKIFTTPDLESSHKVWNWLNSPQKQLEAKKATVARLQKEIAEIEAKLSKD
jgi:hypothetical protein